MKRNLILTLIASAALCPGLHAQDATPSPATSPAESGHPWAHHGGGGGDQLAHLTKALDLTTDEQSKIKPIIDAFHTQAESIKSDTTLAPKDKKAKFEDARETENSQISALLTPDQQAKFAEMQQKMHNHHGGGAVQVAPSVAATPAP